MVKEGARAAVLGPRGGGGLCQLGVRAGLTLWGHSCPSSKPSETRCDVVLGAEGKVHKDTDTVIINDAKAGNQARRGLSFQHHHGVSFWGPTYGFLNYPPSRILEECNFDSCEVTCELGVDCFGLGEKIAPKVVILSAYRALSSFISNQATWFSIIAPMLR